MGLCSRELLLHKSNDSKGFKFAEVNADLIKELTGGTVDK